MAKPVKTVDEYIKALPQPARKTFESVRKAIKSAAPKAEELVSYRVPFYRYNGHLAALNAFSKHCSFVTMSYGVIKNFKNELKPYKISGTTIQFPPGKPLPAALVKKIIKARIKENDDKAASKNKKPAAGGDVDEYMKRLKHPFKKEMESVRKIIKGANKKISERVKWNAPSYYSSADLVTFNHRNEKVVHLVFHHPAIVKIKSALLEGDYKDRRMAYLKNMKEVNSNKKELTRIINELVRLADKNQKKLRL